MTANTFSITLEFDEELLTFDIERVDYETIKRILVAFEKDTET